MNRIQVKAYHPVQGSPGLTILMAENEEVTACFLEFVLQKSGDRVIRSNNGEHAKRLMSVMNHPEAVVIDTTLLDTTRAGPSGLPADTGTLSGNPCSHAHDQC